MITPKLLPRCWALLYFAEDATTPSSVSCRFVLRAHCASYRGHRRQKDAGKEASRGSSFPERPLPRSALSPWLFLASVRRRNEPSSDGCIMGMMHSLPRRRARFCFRSVSSWYEGRKSQSRERICLKIIHFLSKLRLVARLRSTSASEERIAFNFRGWKGWFYGNDGRRAFPRKWPSFLFERSSEIENFNFLSFFFLN